jgi:Mn2+/Fe2+ NRAMP family transporter
VKKKESSFSSFVDRHQKWFVIAFIVISTAVFTTIGQPVKILVLVGALNGLVLPFALGVMLPPIRRK